LNGAIALMLLYTSMSRFMFSSVGEVPFEKTVGKFDSQHSLAISIQRAIEKKALQWIE